MSSVDHHPATPSMISIHVVSYNGRPPAQPMLAEFGAQGGTIGRAETNALVLPDPDRYVSRMHAMIICRDGAFAIRDTGSATPVRLNGKALGNGREAALTGGDDIGIGAYALKVIATQAAADVPFPAAWMDDAGVPASTPATATATANLPVDDPLAIFGSPAGDPFATAGARSSVHAAAAPPTGLQALATGPARQSAARFDAGAYDTIPTEFDPFSDPMTPAPPTDRTLAQAADPALSPLAGKDVDELYGLSSGAGADPFGPDHPLGQPGGMPLQGERAISLDPLEAIGAVPPRPPEAGPQRNDSPEIHAAFIPPVASFHEEQAIAAEAQHADPIRTRDGMLFSWNETGRPAAAGEIKTVVVQSPHPHAPQARRRDAPASGDAAQPAARRTGSSGGSHSAPSGSNPSIAASGVARSGGVRADTARGDVRHGPGSTPDALLQAFLDGAGVPDLNVPGPLTPATMQLLGELMRVATQGTLDLLLARTLIKREVHADVTLIVAQDNNPLKFSPNVETALSHLLAPRGQGFMRPAAAMTDAYNDLRAHQFGFMAGMRAALEGVLQRFDPAELERRLTEKSLVDSVLPMNRKAKLWSLFSELYAEINREAQDDFQTLFGTEFLRAYDAQLAKLENPGRDRDGGPPGLSPARPAKDKETKR
jgi:FHA domain-containing protein